MNSWVYELYQEYLIKEQKRAGRAADNEALLSLFQTLQQEGSLKILVQEPWMGTIRFKTLAGHAMTAPEIQGLYENPMEFLFHLYGGGKFKVNFYHGMNFVATKNFKPQGDSLWPALPEWVEG